jgi:hypothetical protein
MDGSERKHSDGIVSGWFGAGLDWQPKRHFAMTLQYGWQARSGQVLQSGLAMTLGWTFGKARAR